MRKFYVAQIELNEEKPTAFETVEVVLVADLVPSRVRPNFCAQCGQAYYMLNKKDHGQGVREGWTHGGILDDGCVYRPEENP